MGRILVAARATNFGSKAPLVERSDFGEIVLRTNGP